MSLFKKKLQDMPDRRARGSVASGPTTDTGTFRLGRTLVGSASSDVRSSAEQHGQLASTRIKGHHMAIHRRQLLILFGGVAMVCVILGVVISEFTANVVVRSSTDASDVYDAKYSAAAQAYLNERPIERLRFLMNTDELTTYLQADFPEVQSVSTEGSLATYATSYINVTMRRPIASWTADGLTRFVDGAGVAFATNHFTDPAIKVVDNSGIRSANGQTIASNRFLSFIGQVAGEATRHGFIVQEVIIPERTTRQIQLKIKDFTAPIRLTTDRGVARQVEDATNAVRYFEDKQQAPEYVDVRIAGRAFYK